MQALSHSQIFGNWATLLLATDSRGTIDFSRMADEIDVLIASAPNGIYSNGTAGEFYAQSEDEFERISALLADKCERAGVAFQIGVSHTSAQASLERLRRVRELRPGAVQLILPDWFPPTLDEAVCFLQKMEEESQGISLVLYNPPHAKKRLQPAEWARLKENVPALIGVKTFDQDGDAHWYSAMREHSQGLSIAIPGHRLASGLSRGAHGAYSNMACLNPFAAQKWFAMTQTDMPGALELEGRIGRFMGELIGPLIGDLHYANHACDRFMALLGGWADVGESLRWPYRSIPIEYVARIAPRAAAIIPEFFEK